MRAIIDSIRSFQDGAFADLIVRSGMGQMARTWNLHRVIVCPQSKALNDICRSPENLNAPIMKYTLPKELDPDIFDKLVQFWYTGNYQDEDHYRPLIDVPDPAWSMSPEELDSALEPSGDRVGTHDIIVGDKPRFDVDVAVKKEKEKKNTKERMGDKMERKEEEKKGDQEGEEEEDDDDDDDDDYDDDEESEIDEDEVGCDTDDERYRPSSSSSESESSEEGEYPAESGDLQDELGEEEDTDYLANLNNNNTTTALMTSLHVFAMAEHFGTTTLKLVAKERFYRCVERKLVKPDAEGFESPEFVDCLRTLYNMPDTDDKKKYLAPLKEIVVACMHTIIHTFHRLRIMPIIAEHAELAVELLKYNVQAMAIRQVSTVVVVARRKRD